MGYNSTYDQYYEFKEYLRRISDPTERRRVASLGGKARAAQAKRVSGKFAPNDPQAPFAVDHGSHVKAGRKRALHVQVMALRDDRGRFVKEEE